MRIYFWVVFTLFRYQNELVTAINEYENKTVLFQAISKFMRIHGHLHYPVSRNELDKARIAYSLLNFQAFQEHGIAGIAFNFPKSRLKTLANSWYEQGFMTHADKQNFAAESLEAETKTIRMSRSENTSITFNIFNYLNTEKDHCLFMYAFRRLQFNLDGMELTSAQRRNLEIYMRYRTTEMYNIENEPAVRNLKMQTIRYYAEVDNQP